MIIKIDLPDAIAYHFNSVIVPILARMNKELDDFGKAYRVAFEEAAKKEKHNGR